MSGGRDKGVVMYVRIKDGLMKAVGKGEGNVRCLYVEPSACALSSI